MWRRDGLTLSPLPLSLSRVDCTRWLSLLAKTGNDPSRSFALRPGEKRQASRHPAIMAGTIRAAAQGCSKLWALGAKIKSRYDNETLAGNAILSDEVDSVLRGSRRKDAREGKKVERAPEVGSREYCDMANTIATLERDVLGSFLADVVKLLTDKAARDARRAQRREERLAATGPAEPDLESAPDSGDEDDESWGQETRYLSLHEVALLRTDSGQDTWQRLLRKCTGSLRDGMLEALMQLTSQLVYPTSAWLVLVETRLGGYRGGVYNYKCNVYEEGALGLTVLPAQAKSFQQGVPAE